jgi:hypothetical protein
VAIDRAEEGALPHHRGGAPRLECAHWPGLGVRAEGDGHIGTLTELIGLGAPHPHHDAPGGVEGQVAHVEGDELGATERAPEPHQN